jgi:precorrin isomerase/dissimilatory sulfite reductase (desulfoviridin) alpha/beta subunit
MMSGDGLIVRVRAGVRPLTASALATLTALARAHGGGLIELTRRANLQLRGVAPATLATLQAALVDAGLADASPLRELRRALLRSDPGAWHTTHRDAIAMLEGALDDALAAADDLAELPAKFAIVLDGGSGLLGDASADLWIDLGRQGCTFAHVYLGGQGAAGSFAGALAVADVPAAVIACLRAFLAHGGARHRSVRAMIAAGGAAPLIASLGGMRCGCGTAKRAAPAPIGYHAGAHAWLSVGVPLGAGDPSLWHAVASLAARFGDGRVRCAAGRTLVFPGVRDRDQALATAREAGLIVDPRDPLLRTVACAGAPFCTSALGETRAYARALASTFLAARPEATLHVSGCTKSCAKSGASDLSVLMAESGVSLGFGQDIAQTAGNPAIPRETAARSLTASRPDDTVTAPMPRTYDYERDAAAIYRRSFAIIRAEANLARFASPIEERVAVRLVHTSGMVELTDDIVFSPGFAEAAATAMARGAPIFCDTKMVVSGVTRARLAANNEVLSFVDHPEVPALAKAQRTTRTAAALSLWGDRLEGAVVAIGNAPTALFRLLELFDETGIRPAAVIGLPVGFVGAAESKEALIADGRVPAMIVRGRKGGSAMTAAAINALASEKE